MSKEHLKFIFDQFKHQSVFKSFQELTSGHINDTYLIQTKKKPYYVLQRINQSVFQDISGLMANKVGISHHLHRKLHHLRKSERNRRVLSFIGTKNNQEYYLSYNSEFWNMTEYIDQSKTFSKVTDKNIAYEAGKLFGEFLDLTSDYDISKLEETIPNFHNLHFRYEQFEKALKSASKVRLDKAIDFIKIVMDSRSEMLILQHLKDSNVLKIRVTHNDTKISNVLFDLENKALCVIDTDTIMPGIIHYDFGDAIRSLCNTATEDESDLALVKFNITFYELFLKGFLEETKPSLSPIDLEYLPLGAKTMIFIMGLRFLTDYLNHDIYFKVVQNDHNLVRAKNQFKLMESFEDQYTEVYKLTRELSAIH